MKLAAPAFFMPSRTALIDDDTLYIENIADLLPSELSPKVITPDELDAISDANLFCLSGEERTHNFSSAALLMKYFKDNRHNPPVSAIVIDHCMLPKNGLEILENLKSPFVKKILISNLAPQELALEAVNYGIIDGYVSKTDLQFISKLTTIIKLAQSNFFCQLSTLFPNFYSADNPLLDPETAKIFHQIQTQHTAHYYEPTQLFKRFNFFSDTNTSLLELDILSEEYVNSLINSYFAESTPVEIIELIRSGEAMPCFGNTPLPDGKAWHKFMRASQAYQGKKKYFYSIHKDPA